MHYPQSNGWAELAVKTAKRTLMDCIDAYGHLCNDQVAWAIIMYRNTPYQDFSLLPVEMLYGRKIKDHLPYFARSTRFINFGGRQRIWGKGRWQKDICWTKGSTTHTAAHSKSFRLVSWYRCKIRKDHIHDGGRKQKTLSELWVIGNIVYSWMVVAELHYIIVDSSRRSYRL